MVSHHVVIGLNAMVVIGLVQWEIKKYLICHVTTQNYVIKGSCNVMSNSSPLYATTLPSLVVIDILLVEI